MPGPASRHGTQTSVASVRTAAATVMTVVTTVATTPKNAYLERVVPSTGSRGRQGGRRFLHRSSSSATVRHRGVGYGAGRCPRRSPRVSRSQKAFFKVPDPGHHPHPVQGEKVPVSPLRPASPGTGVIAGGPVRRPRVRRCARRASKSLGSAYQHHSRPSRHSGPRAPRAVAARRGKVSTRLPRPPCCAHRLPVVQAAEAAKASGAGA